MYPIPGFPQSIQEGARLFMRQLYIAQAGKKKSIFEMN
jgi:hypothetical protein